MASSTDVVISPFVHGLRSKHVDVVVIPARKDNYMYLIVDKTTKKAAAVDPFDAKKIKETAGKMSVDIVAILTTHSHYDHAGGNVDLCKLVGVGESNTATTTPRVVVYGGKGDRAAGVTKEVGEGDELFVGTVRISVMFTPCHTKGHVCYVVHPKDEAPKCVFSGDTLFVSGCGNFNAGTPGQMASAFKRLSDLPPSTLVYCGHEYTVANLAYASFVEPRNDKIAEKLAWAKQHTKLGGFTVPSRIAEELELNPFMRAVRAAPSVIRHCGGAKSASDAIKFIREEKSSGTWRETPRV